MNIYEIVLTDEEAAVVSRCSEAYGEQDDLKYLNDLIKRWVEERRIMITLSDELKADRKSLGI